MKELGKSSTHCLNHDEFYVLCDYKKCITN